MSSWNDDILIGEGVALSTGAAPVTIRMGSGVIDAIVYGLGVWLLFTVAMPLMYQVSGAWQTVLSITITVVCLVIIPATVETLTRGRSLGRLALGLRIVREDGGPIAFRHALGRAFLGLMEIFATAGFVAVTVSLLNSRGKRLGDVLMGTYSMRIRGAQTAMPRLAMPPWLDAWAATADIRRLPDGVALTARTFVARAHSMHTEARARIGTEIAQALREHVSPDPPAGTHPESFITAVLVARRDREYAYERRRRDRAEQDMARLEALPLGIPDAEN